MEEGNSATNTSPAPRPTEGSLEQLGQRRGEGPQGRGRGSAHRWVRGSRGQQAWLPETARPLSSEGAEMLSSSTKRPRRHSAGLPPPWPAPRAGHLAQAALPLAWGRHRGDLGELGGDFDLMGASMALQCEGRQQAISLLCQGVTGASALPPPTEGSSEPRQRPVGKRQQTPASPVQGQPCTSHAPRWS